MEKDLNEPRSLQEWGDFLTKVSTISFFRRGDGTGPAFNQADIGDLGKDRRLSGFEEKVDLEVIQSLLKSRLESEGFGIGFITGGVTFCAMLPMRSIPFKVICLLGMNDDAYPRQTKSLGI